ncbi:hypothetical protein QFC21_005470 [Naganishia friedmannii]|uniref:Uncharacterized protein n=1 Tax=Naganishia friedmannii TaxID=89922 RepID=A0ACC2V8V7_9TREE|nr:hypothetical protein QFC21_005470 [Naganishia friedmannii]
MSSNSIPMSAEERRLAKLRLQQELELINQQEEADRQRAMQGNVQTPSENVDYGSPFFGQSSNAKAHYSATPSTQQVSINQVMGVKLLERLDNMDSQPVYTTGVVNRIPQPEQLRGGKKGKGTSSKATPVAALKPVQVGVPANENRIFYIPVTQWLNSSGRVFSGGKDLAGMQSDWLVEKGYGPTMELYAGMTAKDVQDMIRARLAGVAPIYEFVFVKHGPSGKTLASGDVRRISDLEHGAVSLSQFFRSCRYCYIFDANFREPTPVQLDFEKEFLKRWNDMTERAKAVLSGECEDQGGESSNSKEGSTRSRSDPFSCGGCPMTFSTAETLQHHSARCDYIQGTSTHGSRETRSVEPGRSRSLESPSPQHPPYRCPSPADDEESDFNFFDPKNEEEVPISDDYNLETNNIQLRELCTPVFSKAVRLEGDSVLTAVKSVLKPDKEQGPPVASDSSVAMQPTPHTAMTSNNYGNTQNTPQDRKPVLDQRTLQPTDLLQALQQVVQRDPRAMELLLSQLLAHQSAGSGSSSGVPPPPWPADIKPKREALEMNLRHSSEVIEISSDEEEDEGPVSTVRNKSSAKIIKETSTILVKNEKDPAETPPASMQAVLISPSHISPAQAVPEHSPSPSLILPLGPAIPVPNSPLDSSKAISATGYSSHTDPIAQVEATELALEGVSIASFDSRSISTRDFMNHEVNCSS